MLCSACSANTLRASVCGLDTRLACSLFTPAVQSSHRNRRRLTSISTHTNSSESSTLTKPDSRLAASTQHDLSRCVTVSVTRQLDDFHNESPVSEITPPHTQADRPFSKIPSSAQTSSKEDSSFDTGWWRRNVGNASLKKSQSHSKTQGEKPRLKNVRIEGTREKKGMGSTRRIPLKTAPDLADRFPKTSHQRELWQSQKEALSAKFGSTGWTPRKKLSPDALEGIRSLHAQKPDKYTTPVIAEQFKISPEAVRRILKSKWRPSEDEEERRRERWNRRGEQIWSHRAEIGIKPPKKWRDQGIHNPGFGTSDTESTNVRTPLVDKIL